MKMEKPTVEAVRFTSADVIATSGVTFGNTVTLGSTGNTIASDNTYNFGNISYTGSDSGVLDVFKTIAQRDEDWRDEESIVFFYGNEPNTSVNLATLLDSDTGSDTSLWNGTYTWGNGLFGYAWYK